MSRMPAVLLALLIVYSTLARSEDWTRFRGPNGSGVSTATTVPTSWTDADYNWKVELPGQGHSSPVIWGEKLFLTAAEDEGTRRMLVCLSTVDGSKLWTREFPFSSHAKHAQNSFATPTATVDNERVYVALADTESYLLVAFDHEGKEAWRYDLGPFKGQHGCGASPMIYEDLVVLGNDQDGPSFLVALDRRTGKERWKLERTPDMVAYSTPCVYQSKDRGDELIFLSSAHGMSGIDPRNGKVNWELPVFDKRAVCSPIVAGDLILGSCGSGAGGNYVVAVRPGSGAQPVASEAYRVDKSAPYVPTSVVKGDLAFLWGDQGVVACIEVASGEVVWRKRVGGNFSSSPICIGEAIYGVSTEGKVVVLKAGRKFGELGEMNLGEEHRSCPAVADGRLYLRTVSHLFSLGGALREKVEGGE